MLLQSHLLKYHFQKRRFVKVVKILNPIELPECIKNIYNSRIRQLHIMPQDEVVANKLRCLIIFEGSLTASMSPKLCLTHFSALSMKSLTLELLFLFLMPKVRSSIFCSFFALTAFLLELGLSTFGPIFSSRE